MKLSQKRAIYYESMKIQRSRQKAYLIALGHLDLYQKSKYKSYTTYLLYSSPFAVYPNADDIGFALALNNRMTFEEFEWCLNILRPSDCKAAMASCLLYTKQFADCFVD